ncbi:Uncharacterized protein FWK35_00021996 [Aphis craccivora]|uniref:Transposable element P transposase-like C-terminal domain-containing protein n=1 Tax=Aphis craccivora TaxID=307492 RepID=A0A6G0YC21_APHCR|nr:Uncharacterized protein FWK35_00021996 [Aphis craccivora]
MTMFLFKTYGFLRFKSVINIAAHCIATLYRLRMIVLGKNPGITSITCISNTRDENNEEFLLSKMLKDADINITINDNDKCVISDTSDSSDDETLNTSNSQEKQYHEEMTKDAVEYLIGWVAKKYRKKYPELGSTTTVLGNTCQLS